jgi:hypothetical protein
VAPTNAPTLGFTIPDLGSQLLRVTLVEDKSEFRFAISSAARGDVTRMRMEGSAPPGGVRPDQITNTENGECSCTFREILPTNPNQHKSRTFAQCTTEERDVLLPPDRFFAQQLSSRGLSASYFTI